jgi:hypothetical protein
LSSPSLFFLAFCPVSNAEPLSAVFQAGGLVVVLVEVSRKAYLASLVPVIVNAILNEHQIIVDIVAFVNKGDFPRSRLSEKQRGKILAGWVSRKMRTMAQFAIKDMDSSVLGPAGISNVEPAHAMSMSGASETLAGDTHRGSLGSFRSSGPGYPPIGPGSNLRNVEHAPQILEHEVQQQQLENLDFRSSPAPLGLVEMPADERQRDLLDNDQTPTKNTHANRISVAALPHGYDLPDFDRFGDDEEISAPLPPAGPTPTPPSVAPGNGGQHQYPAPTPQIRLPGVDGRESFDDWDLRTKSATQGSGNLGASVGDDDWTRDAYMSMNLAGTLGRRAN